MEEQPLIAVSEARLKGLETKVERLKVLMEMSAILSSTLELDDLVSLVMEKAKSDLDAEACSILFYNKENRRLQFRGAICEDGKTSELLREKGTLEMGRGVAGWVAETLQPLFLDDVRADSRFCQEADRFAGFSIKSLIALPLVGRSGLIGVTEILNPRKKDYDPEIVQLLARQFAIAIENSLFYRESLERERLRQELDIASTLQKSFLPESSTFRKGDLTVRAANISAEKVGGDLYDFIEQDEDRVGILIGDVSGKGISAALYMARFSSDFRYVAHLADSPFLALQRLNLSLVKSPRGMFLTCVYLVVDIVTGRVNLSVAGHPPFLLITKGQLKVMSVDAGPPLGIVPAEYPQTHISLQKGDRLLLLTDGVFDAKDRVGQRLGFENLVRFIDAHRNEGDLVNVIIAYVDDYSKGTERADDVTIVELRWGQRALKTR
jgi:sigma-B regulation protein RsbU (phosphoserine phosphatase)